MATDDVIAALVDRLEPVSPLPLPRVRLARWLLAGSAAALCVAVAIGIRSDVAVAMRSTPFLAHAALLLIVAVTAAGAALALSIPGERIGRAGRWVPMLALAVWIAWLVAELWPAVRAGSAWPDTAGWGCVAKALAIGAAPGVGLAWILGRAVPSHRSLTYAAMAGAAAGAFGVEWTCPKIDPMHLLAWHAVPALVLVLAASVVARALLRGPSSGSR